MADRFDCPVVSLAKAWDSGTVFRKYETAGET